MTQLDLRAVNAGTICATCWRRAQPALLCRRFNRRLARNPNRVVACSGYQVREGAKESTR